MNWGTWEMVSLFGWVGTTLFGGMWLLSVTNPYGTTRREEKQKKAIVPAIVAWCILTVGVGLFLFAR